MDVKITELSAQLKQSKKELKELEETLQKMEDNLRNGRELIDGLGAEQIRWTEDKKDKEAKIELLEA